MRPEASEYAPYYERYVSLVPEQDILLAINQQSEDCFARWQAIPEELGNSVQAPYSWTIRQVFLHMMDTERIFAYRTLRFARNDATPIPGFEDAPYATHSLEVTSSLKAVLDEFTLVRRANCMMLAGLSDMHWARGGEASEAHVTVRALAYIMVGHVRHHDRIITKRLASLT